MQNLPNIQVLAPGVRLLEAKAVRPKTTCISLLLLTPLLQDPAEIAVLASYLTHTCKRFPTRSALSAKLESLYGAEISGDCGRLGEARCLRLSLVCLNDARTLQGENVSREALELLLDMLLEPCAKDGAFDEAQTGLERRLCLEDIESEKNDKRAYALQRMLEVMCADEAYGLPRETLLCGVRALTPQSLYAAWRRLLERAQITVLVSGDVDAAPLEAMLKARLSALPGRSPAAIETVFVETCEDISEVVEEEEVGQSKLVLGFRTGMRDRDDDYAAYRVMADVFGGGPYSRLFSNVRERLSLCYYCSARLVRHKGLLLVQSGVERKNSDVAKAEILRQLAVMQAGEFTDEELSASKKALCDAFSGVGDTPEGLDVYYGQLADGGVLSPEQTAAALAAVTREDVVRAAKRVTLDTVYLLAGKEAD